MWRMVCIGTGPGPKNVLAEDEHGHRVVVPYAIWKHRLSKEKRLSDKQYVVAIGMIQKFGDKPAVEKKNHNGQDRYTFTIRTATQQYVSVTLWSEFTELGEKLLATNCEGFAVFADGSYQANESNGKTYHNLSANRCVVIPAAVKAEREVVNQQPAPAQTAEAQAPAASSPLSF